MAVAEVRPKDMTGEQLAALPERGAGGVEYEIVPITAEMLDADPTLCGSHIKRPVMRPSRAVHYEPDDLVGWRDAGGRLWGFGQDEDGGWFRHPLPDYG